MVAKCKSTESRLNQDSKLIDDMTLSVNPDGSHVQNLFSHAPFCLGVSPGTFPRFHVSTQGCGYVVNRMIGYLTDIPPHARHPKSSHLEGVKCSREASKGAARTIHTVEEAKERRLIPLKQDCRPG